MPLHPGSAPPAHTDPAPEALVAGAAALRFGPNGQIALIGSRCGDCGVETVPPVAVCPSCAGESMAEAEQPATGTVYSLTTLHVGPRRWIKPMTVGYVDLPNGVRVFTHLRGDGVGIGSAVGLAHAIVGAEDDGTPIRSFVFQTEAAPAGESMA